MPKPINKVSMVIEGISKMKIGIYNRRVTHDSKDIPYSTVMHDFKKSVLYATQQHARHI